MLPYKPVIGDKVTVDSAESVWTVLSVSNTEKTVGLHVPGTNLERFRVQVRNLTPVGLAPRGKDAPTPSVPSVDVEAISEALMVAQHESVQHLSAIIRDLKERVLEEGAPPKAAARLDKLCAIVDDNWDSVVGDIMKMVESQ